MYTIIYRGPHITLWLTKQDFNSHEVCFTVDGDYTMSIVPTGELVRAFRAWVNFIQGMKPGMTIYALPWAKDGNEEYRKKLLCRMGFINPCTHLWILRKNTQE